MLNIAFHILNYIMRVYSINAAIDQQEKQDLLDLSDNQTLTWPYIHINKREWILSVLRDSDLTYDLPIYLQLT